MAILTLVLYKTAIYGNGDIPHTALKSREPRSQTSESPPPPLPYILRVRAGQPKPKLAANAWAQAVRAGQALTEQAHVHAHAHVVCAGIWQAQSIDDLCSARL